MLLHFFEQKDQYCIYYVYKNRLNTLAIIQQNSAIEICNLLCHWNTEV